jgi:hypothetical protein
MDKSEFIPYLCLWIVAAGAIVWKTWSSAGAGLVLSYCFQMFLLYWMGGLIHALPWSDLPETDYVLLGLQRSTYGIIAFAIGSLAAGPWIARKLQANQPPQVPDPKLAGLLIRLGLVFYFILGPTLGRLPGLNAVGAVGSQFVVVGISLNCWCSWLSGGARALLKSLAPALLIPAATLLTQGFMSYGVIALSTVMIFSAQFFRPRWILLLGGILSGYVGLSGYVAYMRDRDELRAAIWGGDSMSDRISRARETLQNTEWFDWRNPYHLSFVDGRLNQLAIAGAAVTNLSNTGDYAKGSTLIDAAVNMIPRIIWPSKPITAGSGDLAHRFTGNDYAQGTSVGVGPVLELYGNFGDPGIWIGFVVLGCIIKAIDVMAGFHLHNGTWLEFANWYLVGISLLNVSGQFVECTAAAMASLVLARILAAMLKKSRREKLLPDLITG